MKHCESCKCCSSQMIVCVFLRPCLSWLPIDKPDDAAADLLGSDVDLDSPIKTEHSTLIRLLRRRKERREKDSIKERKDIHEEYLNLKDAKQRNKEEDMKSPVILGTKKGKDAEPEEPHLLHIGTPFEVLNCSSRIIS